MKLAVFGDSWGCGSWSTPHERLNTGDGYFTEKFQLYFDEVINYSYGGRSNQDSIIFLEDYLNLNNSKNTKILIIQTDPIRDFIPARDRSNILGIFKDFDFKKIISFQINLFYFRLNNLAVKFDVNINLIGGCSDVDPMYKKYKKLNSPCKSWIQLIDQNHNPSVYFNTFELSSILEELNQNNQEVLSALTSKLDIINSHKGKEFGYGPDDHPSHTGIDLLAENIYNKLI